MSRAARVALIVGLIVAAIVAFIIVSPGGDDDNQKTTSSTKQSGTTGPSGTTTPTFTAIKVEGGKPVGGVTKIEVSKGDRVRFTVSSDVADEIHVHGYDFMKDVAAGGRARFNFPATISGSFEIELENRKEQIAALTVEP
jgi:hypothetical protein